MLPGRHTQGTPAVKYRGFFINDENPATRHLGARGYFGPGQGARLSRTGFNADFYAKVFETMLRLKANYLWPAVWGRAFAEDDPQNHATANALRRRDGHLARGADDARHRGVEPARGRRGATPATSSPGHDPTAAPASGASAATPTPSRRTGATASERMVERGLRGRRHARHARQR